MTLTQASILTRRFIFISVSFLVIGIFSFIGYKSWQAYNLSQIPPVEEKADTKFGILPKLDFPLSNISSSNFTYTLDTHTGNLPKLGEDEQFPKLIKVYFIPKPYASFLSADKSRELALKFEIDTEPQILNDTDYLFTKDTKALEVNLDSGNFVYINESTDSASQTLRSDNELINGFENILTNLGRLHESLKDGNKKVTLLKKEGEDFVPTQARSEAQAAEISIWPSDIDGKPIVTPQYSSALVNGIVQVSSDVLENYNYLQSITWPIDTTDSNMVATYPLKDPQTALDDLRNGKGSVIIEPKKIQVSITSIKLGYYLSDKYSRFLQPIYVFEGPRFVSYVSGIRDEFVSSE